MEKKKQSSVEWLYSKMYEHRGNLTIEEFEQAKAMHKEEQRLTYEGVAQNLGTSIKEYDIPTFEEYYTKTFGGQDNE
jgi:hypothetical protein